MTIALSLFGFVVFQVDILRPEPAPEFVHLSTDTELDEELDPDIVVGYGFSPPPRT